MQITGWRQCIAEFGCFTNEHCDVCEVPTISALYYYCCSYLNQWVLSFFNSPPHPTGEQSEQRLCGTSLPSELKPGQESEPDDIQTEEGFRDEVLRFKWHCLFFLVLAKKPVEVFMKGCKSVLQHYGFNKHYIMLKHNVLKWDAGSYSTFNCQKNPFLGLEGSYKQRKYSFQ